jgi:ribosome-associated protein
VSDQIQKQRETRREAPDSRTVALAVVEAGLHKKALNAEIIDVRGKVDYADYVVVMSGRSDRQVNAIVRGIEDHVRETLGVKCVGVEGLPRGHWALVDYGDVIVHVFHEDTRGYYDLEALWIDAARVSVAD